MEFSAKITRSVYLYLEAQGAVAGDYLEAAGLSAELALDSERWIAADRVEDFLEKVVRERPDLNLKDVALMASDLKGWGLLDQVLRIIQSPAEIYESPQNFLSYFLKAKNPLKWIDRKPSLSVFELDLSTEEYPLVTSYLTGALEVVSKFLGEDLAQVTWFGKTLSIDWSKKQESFFESKEPVNFKPEVLKEAVEIITRQRTELLAYQDTDTESVGVEELPISEILQSLKHLEDYFLRSRQLVSLLRAESGNKKWFKEAVKRLKWDLLEGLHQEKVNDIKDLILDNKKSVSLSTKSDEQMFFSLEAQ